MKMPKFFHNLFPTLNRKCVKVNKKVTNVIDTKPDPIEECLKLTNQVVAAAVLLPPIHRMTDWERDLMHEIEEICKTKGISSKKSSCKNAIKMIEPSTKILKKKI